MLKLLRDLALTTNGNTFGLSGAFVEGKIHKSLHAQRVPYDETRVSGAQEPRTSGPPGSNFAGVVF